MLARLSENAVGDGEVELPLSRLQLLPVDRDLKGVQPEGGGGRPDGAKPVRPAGGVVHLRAEDKVRLPVDHEGRAAAIGDDPGQFMRLRRVGPLLRGGGGRGCQPKHRYRQDRQQEGIQTKKNFHVSQETPWMLAAEGADSVIHRWRDRGKHFLI